VSDVSCSFRVAVAVAVVLDLALARLLACFWFWLCFCDNCSCCSSLSFVPFQDARFVLVQVLQYDVLMPLAFVPMFHYALNKLLAFLQLVTQYSYLGINMVVVTIVDIYIIFIWQPTLLHLRYYVGIAKLFLILLFSA